MNTVSGERVGVAEQGVVCELLMHRRWWVTKCVERSILVNRHLVLLWKQFWDTLYIRVRATAERGAFNCAGGSTRMVSR